MWSYELIENGVRFSLKSAAGDEGYPGNLLVYTTYRLTDDDILTIDYEAETDASTIVNLTNHSFWNLDGEVRLPTYGLTKLCNW